MQHFHPKVAWANRIRDSSYPNSAKVVAVVELRIEGLLKVQGVSLVDCGILLPHYIHGWVPVGIRHVAFVRERAQ